MAKKAKTKRKGKPRVIPHILSYTYYKHTYWTNVFDSEKRALEYVEMNSRNYSNWKLYKLGKPISKVKVKVEVTSA